MIEPWQAKKINDSLGPALRYLGRLQHRMDKTGRHNGKLYKLVTDARNAVFTLTVELHYISVGHGVYREPDK
jgi:hypothetical protein